MVDDSHKDVADVVEVEDELYERVGPGPSTLQALVMDDSHKDVIEMEGMKEELVEQVEPRQEILQALVDEPHEDVTSVIMIEAELEEQVVPGLSTSKTLMRMEDTYFESLHGDMTCVSLEHKEDGPHVEMRKIGRAHV